MPSPTTPAQFIARQQPVQLAERAASQEHFLDLCHLLGQPTPAEHDATGAEYTFERGVAVSGAASAGSQGERGFADVWWRGKFEWEYKRRGKHRDLADVPADARPLIRQSAIAASAASDKRLKKRTLTNLYNERPTWLRLAHTKPDRAVLAAYAAADPDGGWSEVWAEVWTDTNAGQPLPDGHPLAARRAEIDQRVLANQLRLNLARAGRDADPADDAPARTGDRRARRVTKSTQQPRPTESAPRRKSGESGKRLSTPKRTGPTPKRGTAPKRGTVREGRRGRRAE